MSGLFDGSPDRLPADGDLVALVRERHRLNVDRDIIATAKDPLTCALSPLSLALARLAAREKDAPWRQALEVWE
jgi:hypothetical protein